MLRRLMNAVVLVVMLIGALIFAMAEKQVGDGFLITMALIAPCLVVVLLLNYIFFGEWVIWHR